MFRSRRLRYLAVNMAGNAGGRTAICADAGEGGVAGHELAGAVFREPAHSGPDQLRRARRQGAGQSLCTCRLPAAQSAWRWWWRRRADVHKNYDANAMLSAMSWGCHRSSITTHMNGVFWRDHSMPCSAQMPTLARPFRCAAAGGSRHQQLQRSHLALPGGLHSGVPARLPETTAVVSAAHVACILPPHDCPSMDLGLGVLDLTPWCILSACYRLLPVL